MATAKKLPSGNWRVRIFIGIDANGKKRYRSFTDPDRKKVLYEASLYQIEHREERTRMTFKKAMDDYIESKARVLSPTTVSGYKTMQKMMNLHFSGFCELELDRLRTSDLQNLINTLSHGRTPKTVRNYAGFIHSILDSKDITLGSIRLPQKIRPALHIPTDETIRKVLEIAKDTELYIPILLGAFCTMRRGEICGLRLSDIECNTIHVRCSLVKGHDKKLYEKAPKTLQSDRYIEAPAFVIDAIKARGYITKLTPSQITVNFSRLLQRNNILHFRFHDLRHYSASILHALNIPDSYIMERGGWSTDSTLKSVYRHTFEQKSKEEAKKANDYFSNFKV